MHTGLLGTRSKARLAPLLVVLVLVVAIVGLSAVSAHAAPVAAADTCANVDCHAWGPGADPNAAPAAPAATAATPTPVPVGDGAACCGGQAEGG